MPADYVDHIAQDRMQMEPGRRRFRKIKANSRRALQTKRKADAEAFQDAIAARKGRARHSRA